MVTILLYIFFLAFYGLWCNYSTGPRAVTLYFPNKLLPVVNHKSISGVRVSVVVEVESLSHFTTDLACVPFAPLSHFFTAATAFCFVWNVCTLEAHSINPEFSLLSSSTVFSVSSLNGHHVFIYMHTYDMYNVSPQLALFIMRSVTSQWLKQQ